jgi:hypothetical protein
MVFNAIFNNISVISWRLVVLVEETVVPRENLRPVAGNWEFEIIDKIDINILKKVN